MGDPFISNPQFDTIRWGFPRPRNVAAVPTRRRSLLLALIAIVGLATALLLHRVLATVFFAATVATVLVPYYQWLLRQGVPRWWASAAATVSAFVAGTSLFLPIAIVLYSRRTQLRELLASLPDSFVIDVAEFTYVLDSGEATSWITGYVGGLALSIVRSTPELAAHVTVFGFVVFGLLLGRSRLRRALMRPVPDGYHDVVHALHERVRDTLFALYVIQAATALGTFLIALVVFWALGYPFPVTLAVIAGLLQFLPVVGPSLLVLALSAYEASQGDFAGATLVLVFGLTLVGFLPDAVLRPRLARQTAGLPSSLYFVGFTGGLLSVGPVGIIAGPLAVALLSESLSLLADERPAPESQARTQPGVQLPDRKP